MWRFTARRTTSTSSVCSLKLSLCSRRCKRASASRRRLPTPSIGPTKRLNSLPCECMTGSRTGPRWDGSADPLRTVTNEVAGEGGRLGLHTVSQGSQLSAIAPPAVDPRLLGMAILAVGLGNTLQHVQNRGLLCQPVNSGALSQCAFCRLARSRRRNPAYSRLGVAPDRSPTYH